MSTFAWATPEWLHSTGSTNADAMADPWPGRVVVADHQSSGRGRRGRTWSAPPGAALAVSVVVPAPAGVGHGWLPLLAGLAVAQALADSRYAVAARLKWPNDVLASEAGQWRKVCGVLAQTVPAGEGAPLVVVGAGLNVDQLRDDLPGPAATSWRLARGGGAPLPDGARERFLAVYLDRLARLLLDPAGARTAYRERCDTLDREVAVHQPDGSVVTGTAVQVAEDGQLVVLGPGGRTLHQVGDVVHLRPAG